MKAALDARAALAAQRVGLTPEEKAALLQRAEDSRRTQEGSSYQFHAGVCVVVEYCSDVCGHPFLCSSSVHACCLLQHIKHHPSC